MDNENNRPRSNIARKEAAITYHKIEMKVEIDIGAVFRVPLDRVPEATRSFQKWAAQWDK